MEQFDSREIPKLYKRLLNDYGVISFDSTDTEKYYNSLPVEWKSHANSKLKKHKPIIDNLKKLLKAFSDKLELSEEENDYLLKIIYNRLKEIGYRDELDHLIFHLFKFQDSQPNREIYYYLQDLPSSLNENIQNKEIENLIIGKSSNELQVIKIADYIRLFHLKKQFEVAKLLKNHHNYIICFAEEVHTENDPLNNVYVNLFVLFEPKFEKRIIQNLEELIDKLKECNIRLLGDDLCELMDTQLKVFFPYDKITVKYTIIKLKGKG